MYVNSNFSTPIIFELRDKFNTILSLLGIRARGGVVVKALRYKPAGRGFDSRWNFSVT